MSKRAWLNIVLLMTAGVLASLAWYEPGHPPPPPAVKLTALTPEMINKVVIAQRGEAEVILVRRDGGWWLDAPLQIPADTFHVENVLHLVQAESLAQFPAAGRDLAQFGLQDPLLTVRFNDTAMAFGDTNPLDQRHYVKLGDTVHLISESHFFDLKADPAAFVNRALVPAGSRIIAIDLPDVKIARSAQGDWSMTPVNRRLPADAPQRLADAWRDAQAVRVEAVAEPPAARGVVTLRLEGRPEPLRYQIIAREPELILARRELGMQFRLAKGQADRLLRLATEPASPEKK